MGSKEILSLQSRKNRIKEAYLKEIVDVEEFWKDYKMIDEKLAILEEKRLEVIDANKQTFSPQALMADRDVEKENQITRIWNNRFEKSKERYWWTIKMK